MENMFRLTDYYRENKAKGKLLSQNAAQPVGNIMFKIQDINNSLFQGLDPRAGPPGWTPRLDPPDGPFRK